MCRKTGKTGKTGTRIEIFDSTLRDGAQGEGISFTVEDKALIAKKLDKLNISFIEAGIPASNPKDAVFFEKHKELLQNARLVAFGSTCRKNEKACNDKRLMALLSAPVEILSIFGKASRAQAEIVLKATADENLRMISDTVSLCREKGKRIFFDAEHFFDGYKEDSQYALACLKAAIDSGAERIILCDTNGGSFPNEVYEIVSAVAKHFPDAGLGIHCHNDNGCAVANSIMAVQAGAIQVQGTYLGVGERAGNANLSTLIPDLQLKLGYSCIPQECMERLTKTARFIAEVSNTALEPSLPYVGRSAFSHKGGMHVDGVSKNPSTFEQVEPGLVGNVRNLLISEMSGRTAMLEMLQEIDPAIEKDSEKAKELMGLLKELEAKGYIFESARASLILRLRKKLLMFSPFFKLNRFKVIGEQTTSGVSNLSSAMINIEVKGQTEITAAEGDGPVHALDLALKRAVSRFYPEINHTKLTDYKVRVIEPSAATAALVRVLITTTDGIDVWTTVGVSRDIIEASLNALMDSVEYKLLKDGKH